MGDIATPPMRLIEYPVPDDVLADIAEEAYKRGSWLGVARQMREIVMAESELALAMKYLANSDHGVAH